MGEMCVRSRAAAISHREGNGRWGLNNYRIMAPGACQKSGSTTSGCTPRLAASSFLFLPLPPSPPFSPLAQSTLEPLQIPSIVVTKSICLTVKSSAHLLLLSPRLSTVQFRPDRTCALKAEMWSLPKKHGAFPPRGGRLQKNGEKR